MHTLKGLLLSRCFVAITSIGDCMRIALVSMDQQWHAKDANLQQCSVSVSYAANMGCELIVFPEMTLTGYSIDAEAVLEVESSSYALQCFADLADRYRINIVFGACFFQERAGKLRNAFCLAQPGYGARAIYEKVHPFSFAGEDKIFAPGERVGGFRIEEFGFGAAVCYDLRFPELYAAMASSCEALITIANWPKARIKHWRLLLQARAIENQCYSIGVNRVGVDGNELLYEKSSMIASPDGDVLTPVAECGDVEVYEVDLSSVADCRGIFPTLRDKRYSLYAKLFNKING